LGHPQLMKGVVAHDVTIDCAASHVGLRVEQRFAPGAGRANPAKRTLPKLASFSNVAGAVYYIINLFPFANLTLECDNAMLSLWMPAGASETRLFVHHYFVGDAAADPRYALARAESQAGRSGIEVLEHAMRNEQTYRRATQAFTGTMRTISTNQPDGWIHPGYTGAHLVAEVEHYIRRVAPAMVEAAMRRLGVPGV